jgi:circadian clock protein KaiB
VNADGASDHAMADGVEFWDLRLYVIGRSSKSLRAAANLKQLCEKNLTGRYEMQVIDLAENPSLATSENIVATPTLVRRLPPPVRKLIGDLSDTERLLVFLRS